MDPSVRCQSSQWNSTFLPAAIGFLMIYVVSYLGVMVYALSTYHRHPPDSGFHVRFAYLFDRFSPRHFYWNVVLFFRKVIITYVILAIPS